jgi:hypothetical protein
MTVTSIATINDTLNRVAVEVGFTPVADPWTDTDQHWLQMRYLAQVTGDELVLAYPWEFLNKSHQITTSDLDSGDYPLPADFMDMLDQTGWERKSNVPLNGPLSPQEWTYLLGRDLVSSTVYASFRIKEGLFSVFPQPPPDGLDINFEYQSNGWIRDIADQPQSELQQGTDTPLFDKTMFSRYLKSKWLDAKGFDSTRATDDFSALFSSLTGKDKGARILNAGGRHHGMPYLDAWRNTAGANIGDGEPA